jgi:hexosaminidase
MTPGAYCYFDHAQSKNEDSLTIGGYVPVSKTYSYEPVPKELSETEGKHIMGAQGNVWTEYITNPKKVEYMIFPRMSALSEVLWSPADKRNWDDFQNRLQQQCKRYTLWGANYNKTLE